MTQIILIVDRSGSMSPIASEMTVSINTLVREQSAVRDSEAFLTFAQFDDRYELLMDSERIENVPPITIVPRGGTALLDAVGKTVQYVRGQKRKGLHIVVVVTDGYENSSVEWTRESVKKLVEECVAEKWEFVYLGANVDAFTESANLGIHAHNAASYGHSAGGVHAAMSTTSANIVRTRGGGVAAMSYDSTQRKAMDDTSEPKGETTTGS